MTPLMAPGRRPAARVAGWNPGAASCPRREIPVPAHPLQDLAWTVDTLLRSAAVKARFASQIKTHLTALRSGLPRPALIANPTASRRISGCFASA